MFQCIFFSILCLDFENVPGSCSLYYLYWVAISSIMCKPGKITSMASSYIKYSGISFPDTCSDLRKFE